MIKIIEEMLVYIVKGEETEVYKCIRKRIDKVGTKVIILNIIDWLKLEHKRGLGKRKFKAMKLYYDCDWCCVIRDLVQEESIFSENFSINGDEFSFNESVDENSRNEARKIVYEGFSHKIWS